MQNEEKDAVTKHSYTFHFINANKEQNKTKHSENIRKVIYWSRG